MSGATRRPCGIQSAVTIDNIQTTSLIVNRGNMVLFPLMSSRDRRPDARARIVRAAAKLLATGGRHAVTTRAVSAAAGVQPPTIYRHFGDMQGLLGVVARETLAVHVREQAIRALTNDPVEDLRRGWDLHIAYGLANPDAFALLYSAPSVAAYTSVIQEGVAVLQGLVARVAEAGRLRVDVVHATVLIHAAGTGVTLTLAATAPEERDPRLSETMREAILAAITVAPRAKRPTSGPARPGERVAVHAVALRAVLDEASELLSPGEEQLCREWLDRLAGVSAVRAADSDADSKPPGKRSTGVESRGRR
jgi:AcrR family transcriptional regulator